MDLETAMKIGAWSTCQSHSYAHDTYPVPDPSSARQTQRVAARPDESYAIRCYQRIADVFTAARNVIVGSYRRIDTRSGGGAYCGDREVNGRRLSPATSMPDVYVKIDGTPSDIHSTVASAATQPPEQIFLDCIKALRAQLNHDATSPPSGWRAEAAMQRVQKTFAALDALLLNDTVAAMDSTDSAAIPTGRVNVLLGEMQAHVEALVNAQPTVYWPNWLALGGVVGTFVWGMMTAIAAEERDEKAPDWVMRPLDGAVMVAGVTFFAYQIIRQICEQVHVENPKNHFALLRQRLHQVRLAHALSENEGFNVRRGGDALWRPAAEGRGPERVDDESLRLRRASPEAIRLLRRELRKKVDTAGEGEEHFEVLERLVEQMEIVPALPLEGELHGDSIEIRAWQAVRARFLTALATQLGWGVDGDNNRRPEDASELAAAVKCLGQQVALTQPWARKGWYIARMTRLSRGLLLGGALISLVQVHRKDVRATALSINALDQAQLMAFGVLGTFCTVMEAVKAFSERYGEVDRYDAVLKALHQWNTRADAVCVADDSTLTNGNAISPVEQSLSFRKPVRKQSLNRRFKVLHWSRPPQSNGRRRSILTDRRIAR